MINYLCSHGLIDQCRTLPSLRRVRSLSLQPLLSGLARTRRACRTAAWTSTSAAWFLSTRTLARPRRCSCSRAACSRALWATITCCTRPRCTRATSPFSPKRTCTSRSMWARSAPSPSTRSPRRTPASCAPSTRYCMPVSFLRPTLALSKSFPGRVCRSWLVYIFGRWCYIVSRFRQIDCRELEVVLERFKHTFGLIMRNKWDTSLCQSIINII